MYSTDMNVKVCHSEEVVGAEESKFADGVTA